METNVGADTLPSAKRLGGYTLVEILPAIIIWGLLITGLLPVIHDYWSHSTKAVAMAEERRDIQRALRTIELSAAYATDITADDSRIVITKPEGRDIYEYSQGVLYRVPPTGKKYALVQNLSGFSAVYSGFLKVQLQFGGEEFVSIVSPR